MITDDYGYECTETRKLPLDGGANIICSRRGYEREMAYRRERNAAKYGLMAVANKYEIPSWESLELYEKEGV